MGEHIGALIKENQTKEHIRDAAAHLHFPGNMLHHHSESNLDFENIEGLHFDHLLFVVAFCYAFQQHE